MTLPANPIYIDFPRSDGDPSSRPSNTEYVEDSNGQINWMEACDIDDPRSVRWRLGIAAGAAKQLDMPGADRPILLGPEF